MQRFFCSSPVIVQKTITITDRSQVHHLRDVVRLKPGEKIVIFDAKQEEYECMLREVSENVSATIVRHSRRANERATFSLAIACALPKNAKFDDIVDKLTQLGVARIIPLVTERVIVRLDKERVALKVARWRKIAVAAAEQSQRSDVPLIDEVMKVKDVLEIAGEYDLKLIPTLEGQRKKLAEVVLSAKLCSCMVLIGPEGDFTAHEVALAQKAGFIAVSLGERVLRVDTAAIASTAFIQLHAHR